LLRNVALKFSPSKYSEELVKRHTLSPISKKLFAVEISAGSNLLSSKAIILYAPGSSEKNKAFF
jgi:hypothetical protein